MTDRHTPAALRRFAKITAFSTLFLIFAGAMVTSTNSGLAVPDWPLSYGKVNPPMVGGIFYEHGHRVIASFVGLLTLIQAFWLQRSEPKTFLRKLGWASLALVILQGLFGGLTVLLKLPPAVSVLHAAFAEIFFCFTIAMAFFASRAYPHLEDEPDAGGHALAYAIVFAVFLQILLGAWMRHLGAGMAIPDFPRSFGQWVPAFTSSTVAIAYAHRVGALVVTLLILAAGAGAFRSRYRARTRLYVLMLMVLTMQVTLGAYTIWSGKQPVITSFHVATGAALLAVSLLYALAVRSARRAEGSEGLTPLARREAGAIPEPFVADATQSERRAAGAQGTGWVGSPNET